MRNFAVNIAAGSPPGGWYKGGNEANKVIVHVARISQSRRRDRHDCRYQLIDLEMAEMFCWLKDTQDPNVKVALGQIYLWKGGTGNVKPLSGNSRQCGVVQHNYTVCRLGNDSLEKDFKNGS